MNTSPSSTDTTKSKLIELLQTRKSWFPKAIRYTWIAFLTFMLGLPLYVFTVSVDLFGLFGAMPSLAEVENPENDLSSELISADGVTLGRYFRYNSGGAGGNRSQVTFDELSDTLVNTLVLSEDHRFYQHSGLDFPAYLRVVWGLMTLQPAGGGSTITQQLAKNLYTQNRDKGLDGLIAELGRYPRRLVQKTKEWIISVNLERNFTKQEIIAMYLNTTGFSSNSYGIKVASETYFNKPPDSLNLQESALLIGMLQAPTFYNPVLNPENAIRKRNEVLYKLFRNQYILTTREQYDSVAAMDLGLQFRLQDQNEGPAPYFRTVIQAHLMQFCAERGIDLWNSGLKIYTTIDSRLQRYAEESMKEHMKVLQAQFTEQWEGKNPWVDDDRKEIPGFLRMRIKQSDTYKRLVAQYGEGSDSLRIMLNLKRPMKVFTWNGERDTLFSSMDSLAYYKRFLQSGMMAMDPNTGHIKAWVGGFNYRFFKYDHVKQGTRQPGSAFKPFVYGLAMESGYSPCYVLEDIAPSFKLATGESWYPPNSDGTRGSGEKMTIRQAMARSINSITAQLIKSLGEQNVVDFAHLVGIESKLDAVPSLCLGVSDVSLYELVGAYGTFVNNGIHTQPFYITRIEDKNGNVIDAFVPKTRQSINDQTAYKMIYMFMGGTEESGGTSQGLSRELRIDNEIGGKTGTTNNASDGWYIGLTHDLVTGVWVGGDERAIHFPSWYFGQGTRSARPIWDKFMMKVYADPSTGIVKGKFKVPRTGLDISLDCARYHQPDSVRLDDKPWDINR